VNSIRLGVHTCTKCGAEYESWEFVTMRACTRCNGTSFMFKAKDGDSSKVPESSDVRVLDNGVFEINIGSLAQHDPIIIEGDDSIFFIKLPKKKRR